LRRQTAAAPTIRKYLMKKSTLKPTPKHEAPVFENKVRQRRSGKAVTPPKGKTRDNIFSKSRDTREDRSARQMKTSHSSQTLSRGTRS
jgi:hypothetical protein